MSFKSLQERIEQMQDEDILRTLSVDQLKRMNINGYRTYGISWLKMDEYRMINEIIEEKSR